MQGNYGSRSMVLAAVYAAVLLLLAALWVPVDLISYEPYRAISLLFGIQPRAVLGTIAHLLQLSELQFKAIKIGLLFLWLFLILWQFAQFLRLAELPDRHGVTIFLSLGFIYAFGTVTFLTYSTAGFIDVAPFLITLLVVILTCVLGQPLNWIMVAAVTLLLVVGIMTHEQQALSFGILFVWFTWKFGMPAAVILVGPATAISALFLSLVASKKTVGLPPARYLDILQSGFTLLQTSSFNIWGILSGGGALWVLFGILAVNFVSAGSSIADRWRRFATASLMVSVCLSALLIAVDTNRMIGLLWLPVLLLMQETDLRTIFASAQARAALVILCCYQFLLPPVLIYTHGVLPLNCYSLALASRLPREADIEPETMGPAGLYLLARPDLNKQLRANCGSGADRAHTDTNR